MNHSNAWIVFPVIGQVWESIILIECVLVSLTWLSGLVGWFVEHSSWALLGPSYPHHHATDSRFPYRLCITHEYTTTCLPMGLVDGHHLSLAWACISTRAGGKPASNEIIAVSEDSRSRRPAKLKHYSPAPAFRLPVINLFCASTLRGKGVCRASIFSLLLFFFFFFSLSLKNSAGLCQRRMVPFKQMHL